jgi:hypothetical protein
MLLVDWQLLCTRTMWCHVIPCDATRCHVMPCDVPLGCNKLGPCLAREIARKAFEFPTHISELEILKTSETDWLYMITNMCIYAYIWY